MLPRRAAPDGVRIMPTASTPTAGSRPRAPVESSGIRKVFELGRSLKDPVNLSIGQPDFDVPAPIKAAAHAAIDAGRNGYTVTQGIPELRAKLLTGVRRRYHTPTASCSSPAAPAAASCWRVLHRQPGDEVIFFDPFFVMYPHVLSLTGGKAVVIDTYPDFGLDVDRVRAAITPRPRRSSSTAPRIRPARVYPRDALRDSPAGQAAQRPADEHEIYSAFCYDEPFCSPAEFNEDVLVLDGFSKTYGMTGWRLGYCHGRGG